ncbi:hypothetical protein RM844_01965 [Streptomyces sp. DSM 44915]|uniref:Lipoprotein n=1 Tax=Streptomyces chisholmiae TaxID=3075540 RepID=A0ABU2JJ88_9ACTN|nr:hypothetical protein [Streptomyces sp. DSM 44915]MDT0265049.1 hypothetical protein [Streptomyces sp. DSM 44915]
MRTRMIVPVVTVAGLLLAGCGSDSGTSDGSQQDDPGRSVPDENEDDAPEERPDDGTTGGEATGGEAGGEAGGGEAGEGTDQAAAAFEARVNEVAESWPEPAPPGDGHEQLTGLTGMDAADSTADELTVRVGHGQCDADFGAWVAETEDLVIVGGWFEPDPEVQMCAEILLVDEVPVELNSELGDRTVVDAVSGEEVAVEAGALG